MRNFRDKPVRDSERERLFCRHCEESRDSEDGVKRHVKLAHAIDYPTAGDDYLSAPGIERMLAEEDAAADHFDLAVESLTGVDDFLLECGDA